MRSLRKRYNKKRKTVRKKLSYRSKKGGTFFNSGSYGKVYGNPRIPCSDETINDVYAINNSDRKQVSKIFGDSTESKREYSVKRRLEEHMSESEIEKLSNYAVLPLKICEINRDAVKRYPFNTLEWMINKNKKRYDTDILNELYPFIPRNYNTQIIYPEGGYDGTESFQRIRNETDFIKNIRYLLNPIIGVQLLHSYNFMVGDIKSHNIINIDGTFKLIDVADICNVEDLTDFSKNVENWSYAHWPSLVSIGMVHWWNDKRHPDIGKESHDLMHILKCVCVINKSGVKQYFRDIHDLYVKPFNITTNHGFTSEQIEHVNEEIMHPIVKDKVFNYCEDCNMNTFIENINNFDAFLSALNSNNINIVNFVRKLEDNIREIQTKKHEYIVHNIDFKNEMAKRIDVHSIGILILTCIRTFIQNYTRELSRQCRRLIITLYEIVKQCCVFDVQFVGIDSVIAQYEEALRVYYGETPRADSDDSVDSLSPNKTNEPIHPIRRQNASSNLFSKPSSSSYNSNEPELIQPIRRRNASSNIFSELATSSNILEHKSNEPDPIQSIRRRNASSNIFSAPVPSYGSNTPNTIENRSTLSRIKNMFTIKRSSTKGGRSRRRRNR